MLALFALPAAFGAAGALASEPVVVIPAPSQDLAASGDSAVAVFAGGCFWGVQGVFQHVKGVKSAVSGYAGGPAESAHYELVGTGITGHAETVEITYDPGVVSYGTLLQVYFSVAHNPTQLNYQGPDRGTQYRSTIFVASDEQRAVAEAYIAELDAANLFPAPIVTTIEPLAAFYPAEQYHQDFLTLNPAYPYIVYNDLPKIASLQRLFPAEFSAEPALVGML
ncbi:MAG: peptide-methionine (S)-S-oxide reductase MsrA [Cucumibacter sp.]